MTALLGHSISYRIAVGPQAWRKVFTLQTLPARDELFDDGAGKVAGISLHAGVAAKAHERKKLVRLCRYDVQGSTSVAGGRKPGATISRPAVSEKRLSLTPSGDIRYQLKTPYRDGTTRVIFEPLGFMYRMYGMPRAQGCAGAAIARLAALAPKTLALLAGWALPKPRLNLMRFHVVFAPNSKHRALVTPAKRGKGNRTKAVDDKQEQTLAEQRTLMTWAQRLKQVFKIDIETCSACGGAMKVIACIEDAIIIKKILDHLKDKAEVNATAALPESRAPPTGLPQDLFD